jgi:hypothetical protein
MDLLYAIRLRLKGGRRLRKRRVITETEEWVRSKIG